MIPYFPQGTLFPERAVVHQLVREAAVSGDYILKSKCRALEEEVCDVTGAQEAIAVASGTAALTLCLQALDIKAGDEVIVPAFCFVSCVNAVINLGATPVFADCAGGQAVVGADEIAACITPRTRAIVVAHLFTWLADMPLIMSVAKRAGVPVIEDAAVALGAHVQSKPAGLWGDIGFYSFFPVKPVGGLGEGGMIVGADPELMRTCRWLRNHGQDGIVRFKHHLMGHNCRMDEIAAGFLLHRLKTAPQRLQRRAEIAAGYVARLSRLAPRLVLPPCGGERGLNYVYVVQSEQRDELAGYLRERGVQTHIYYDPITPEQAVYARYAGRGQFPNAARIARRHLALPLYPELTQSQLEHLTGAMEAYHAQG